MDMALSSVFSGCRPCSSKRPILGISLLWLVTDSSSHPIFGIHVSRLNVRRQYWLATPEEASGHRKLVASPVVPRFWIRAADEEWRRLRDSYYEENKKWSIK